MSCTALGTLLWCYTTLCCWFVHKCIGGLYTFRRAAALLWLVLERSCMPEPLLQCLWWHFSDCAEMLLQKCYLYALYTAQKQPHSILAGLRCKDAALERTGMPLHPRGVFSAFTGSAERLLLLRCICAAYSAACTLHMQRNSSLI